MKRNDMASGLSHEEVDFLIKAVDEAVKGMGAGKLNRLMIGAIMCPKDKRAEFKADMKATDLAADEADRLFNEQATLVKAKLIILKRSLAIDDAAAQGGK